MSKRDVDQPRYSPGDRVKLVTADEFNPLQDSDEVEVGIIVWVWLDAAGFYDYYVAFFGSEFPDGKPEPKPYILRYGEAVLRPWHEDD